MELTCKVQGGFSQPVYILECLFLLFCESGFCRSVLPVLSFVVMYCVVQVIGVAPKSAVVQNLSAVPEQGSQPHVQAVITENKKEPPAMFSQVS